MRSPAKKPPLPAGSAYRPVVNAVSLPDDARWIRRADLPGRDTGHNPREAPNSTQLPPAPRQKPQCMPAPLGVWWGSLIAIDLYQLLHHTR
jgi:hypothetical protein